MAPSLLCITARELEQDCGRLKRSPPRCLHPDSKNLWICYLLHGKRDFSNVIMYGFWLWSWIIQWAQCNWKGLLRGRQEDQSEKGMWKIGVLWPQMPAASEGWKKQGKDFHPDLPEVTILVDTLIFSLPWLLTTRTLRGEVCVVLNHWVCDNFSQQP